MAGEESQIGSDLESRTSSERGDDITHELRRAVSGIPNPAVEPVLEKAEAAEAAEKRVQ